MVSNQPLKARVLALQTPLETLSGPHVGQAGDSGLLTHTLLALLHLESDEVIVRIRIKNSKRD